MSSLTWIQRSRRYRDEVDCRICGNRVKAAQGYILIEAKDYTPIGVRLRPLRRSVAHKRCWKAL